MLGMLGVTAKMPFRLMWTMLRLEKQWGKSLRRFSFLAFLVKGKYPLEGFGSQRNILWLI